MNIEVTSGGPSLGDMGPRMSCLSNSRRIIIDNRIAATSGVHRANHEGLCTGHLRRCAARR